MVASFLPDGAVPLTPARSASSLAMLYLEGENSRKGQRAIFLSKSIARTFPSSKRNFFLIKMTSGFA